MKNKYVGIALIIVGTVLVCWGFDSYDSAGSKLTRALSGDAPLEAWAAMIGGLITVGVGVFQVK